MDESDRHRGVEAAYAAHADDVYRVAYAILHDRDDAVDATQETFVRAFRNWDRYDSSRPLRPWLHGIVSHVALDVLRRRRVRHLTVASVDPSSASGSARGDPGAFVPSRVVVAQALSELAPVPRAAVLLRHRYGYDYADIARMLGVSETNVGAILTRARAALRARLVDERGAAATERGA